MDIVSVLSGTQHSPRIFKRKKREVKKEKKAWHNHNQWNVLVAVFFILFSLYSSMLKIFIFNLLCCDFRRKWKKSDYGPTRAHYIHRNTYLWYICINYLNLENRFDRLNHKFFCYTAVNQFPVYDFINHIYSMESTFILPINVLSTRQLF